MITGNHIIALKVSNYKRIKAVSLKLDAKGNTIVISGRNAQGKSSLIDSICSAFAGKKWDDAKPIRMGENRASIEVRLDDGTTIKKTITEKTTQLTITSKAGITYPTPQALLDGLVGKISFDPLAYSRLKEKEQVEELLRVIDIDIDLDEMDATKREIYSKRHGVNQEVKRLEVKISEFSDFAPDLPDKEVSVLELTDELEQANKAFHNLDMTKKKIERLEIDIAICRKEQQDAEEEIRKWQEILEFKKDTDKKLIAEFHEAKKCLSPLVESAVDDIKEKISAAEETNRMIRRKNEFGKIQEELALREAESEAFTQEMNDLDNQKAKSLKNTKFPIKGLGFDEDGVSFNSIPLKQASSSEQTRVSTGIAIALNPNLKAVFIKDGSLLDNESMKVIYDMAVQHNFQIFIERVDASGDVGIVIEDGSVVPSESKFQPNEKADDYEDNLPF